jgi:hypothetical protein
VVGGGGQGDEMTQIMYARVNKNNNNKKEDINHLNSSITHNEIEAAQKSSKK